jgi:hypothetical protein
MHEYLFFLVSLFLFQTSLFFLKKEKKKERIEQVKETRFLE